jgi:hypothetical protein
MPEMELNMHEHHIDDMVRQLKPVLKDPSQASAILNRYWSTRMALVWRVDDVFRAANELGVALTKRVAIKLLQALHAHHNPQYGIRREDLTASIKNQVMGRKLTKPELKRFATQDHITVQK